MEAPPDMPRDELTVWLDDHIGRDRDEHLVMITAFRSAGWPEDRRPTSRSGTCEVGITATPHRPFASMERSSPAGSILSWTTAYQLLHRAARVQRGQRVLVHGAAGAVGQALLALGRLAGVELWGVARGADTRASVGSSPRARAY